MTFNMDLLCMLDFSCFYFHCKFQEYNFGCQESFLNKNLSISPLMYKISVLFYRFYLDCVNGITHRPFIPHCIKEQHHSYTHPPFNPHCIKEQHHSYTHPPFNPHCIKEQHHGYTHRPFNPYCIKEQHNSYTRRSLQFLHH